MIICMNPQRGRLQSPASTEFNITRTSAAVPDLAGANGVPREGKNTFQKFPSTLSQGGNNPQNAFTLKEMGIECRNT